VTRGITERMKDIEKVRAQLEGLARKWHAEGEEIAGGHGTAGRGVRTATHA